MVNLLKDIDDIVIDIMDRQDGIEVLLEILGLLRITEEYTLKGNKTTKPAIPKIEEMSTALALVVYSGKEQAVMFKSMVPDSE